MKNGSGEKAVIRAWTKSTLCMFEIRGLDTQGLFLTHLRSEFSTSFHRKTTIGKISGCHINSKSMGFGHGRISHTKIPKVRAWQNLTYITRGHWVKLVRYTYTYFLFFPYTDLEVIELMIDSFIPTSYYQLPLKLFTLLRITNWYPRVTSKFTVPRISHCRIS